MFPKTIAVLIVMAAVLELVVPAAVADDFRVDNSIFLDNEKEPDVQSTTIFCGGLVYDYLKTPAEITVFDKGRNGFVLLDAARRVKTEVSLDKVTALAEHLQTWAIRQNDPLLAFLANPKFDEQFRENAGKLLLASPLVTYDLTTVSIGSSTVSAQYREFCDWYCQLNTLLNPGSRPPFARMVVNRALDQRQLFPQEVKLTVQTGSGFPARRMTIRSQHRFVGPLVESDRDRVSQTAQFLAIFNPVPFAEYQRKVAE